MNLTTLSLLQADPAAGPLGGVMGFLPMIAIIAIFYFLIIRPQNKKQKETQKMLAALKKGDKIVTIGGIHGVVHSIKDSTVIVRVDENTRLEFNRSAIAAVDVPGSGKADSKEDKADAKADKAEDKKEAASLSAPLPGEEQKAAE